MRALVFGLAALIVGLGAGRAAAAEPSFRVAAAPGWVAAVEAESAAAVPEGAARDGVYQLLSDSEVRVSAAGVESYLHVARKIVSASGVEAAAELRFEFDPPQEQLVLHHIRVVRGGHAEDALRPREIHVIQQETDLSQRIYNGTLTAVAFLRDVRAGDVIDYAYSLNGRNPVLGDRYSGSFRLSGGLRPVRRLRLRLSLPEGRALSLLPRSTAEKPVEAVGGQERHYLWDLRDVPALRLEDELPRWFNPVPRVEITEYTGFDQVAAWAMPLFAVPAGASKGLAEEIATLQKAAPDEAGRMLAALRFVQDEVRYLGIELGPHSHKPQAPATVLERRFGDCKDKALLLVTLLRALGIEAAPALVNPDLGRGLDERAPSPLAFNHAIVRATLHDGVYWLDPTTSSRGGGLKMLPLLDYERALVVAPDSAGLTVMPALERSGPSIEERIEIDAHDDTVPVTLKVKTIYHGDAAEGMREDLESSDRAGLSRNYLNYYARSEPAIEEAAAPVVNDEREHDRVTIDESYRIPDYWRDETKWLESRLISASLPAPEVALRTMPLRVKRSSLVQRITMVMPSADLVVPAEVDLSDEAMSLHCSTQVTGLTATFECRYQTRADSVPAPAVADHLRLAGKMRDALALSVTRTRGGEPRSSGDSWQVGLAILGLTAAGVLLVFAVRIVRQARQVRRKRVYRRDQTIGEGESPALAIAVATREAMESRALRSKCTCGARPGGAADLAMGKVLLGERALTSVRLVCRACGTPRSLYFELP